MNRVVDGITPYSSTESTACQPRREASARLLPLVRPLVIDQGLEDRRILTGNPLFDGSSGKVMVTRALGIEDPVDGLVGEVLCDPLGTELRRECGAALGAVSKAVTHEGGSDARVVNQSSVLQSIETQVDPDRMKPLLPQALAKFGPGSGPIREQVERGIPDPDVGIVIQQSVAIGARERVSHTQSTPFEGLQHDLEGLGIVVQVDKHLQTAWSAGLNPGNERVGAQDPVFVSTAWAGREG